MRSVLKEVIVNVMTVSAFVFLVVFFTYFLLVSCGISEDSPTPGNAVGGTGPGGGSITNFAQAKAACERCHSGAEFLGSEDALKGSAGANSRVASGNMPPPGSPEASGFDKQGFLDYLKS